jgi:hypothetical protein
MTLTELFRESAGVRIVDEDGSEDTLRLLPPATANEIVALEASLPCPIPADVRDLLDVTRGFGNGPLETFDLIGLADAFGMEDVFPHAHPIAHDGFGNFWVVDLHADSTDWSPIWFACHDPPVIAWQTDSLEHFVRELLRFANPPHESDIDTVHERVTAKIWRDDPGTMAVDEAEEKEDASLREFARTLDESWTIVDLRRASLGDGFSWGRYGPRTNVARHGREALFAYRKPAQTTSLWRRLFGR